MITFILAIATAIFALKFKTVILSAGLLSLVSGIIFIMGINNITHQISVVGFAVYIMIIAGILGIITNYIYPYQNLTKNNEITKTEQYDEAEELARKRLASGEIDQEEYDKILNTLRKR